jgi:hypothetical protein
MPQPTVQVRGARELRRAIRQAQDKDLKKELSRAHKSAADIVANEAKRIVPRRSGRLQGSIRPGGTQTSGVVRAGKAAVPYAGVIHFGWPRRNIRPNTFLYDAADARVDEVVAQYEEAIRAIGDRIASSTPGGTP